MLVVEARPEARWPLISSVSTRAHAGGQPTRFGVQLPTFGPTATSQLIVDTARAAEALGYDSVWVNDHVMVPPRLEPPYGRIMEAVVTLATVSAVTDHILLGTSCLILPQRPPIVTAKQLATLDVLSGGRLICGVAAGYVEEQFGFLGAQFGQRGSTLDEYVDVMRHLWSTGGGSYQGSLVNFSGALFGPQPARGGGVPIWIGGNGRAAIARAARTGDAWHPAGLTAPELSAGVAALRSAAAGRPVGVTLKLRAGLTEVVDRYADQVSPAAAGHAFELVGRTEQVRGWLESYQSAGCEHLVLFFFHVGPDDLERSMSLFAEKVARHFTGP